MTAGDDGGRPQGEGTVLRRAVEVRSDDGVISATLDWKLGDLVARHKASVLRVCLRITGDQERAEELAQEALLVAWRRLPEYDPARGDFGGWIYGIARNLAFNAVRRRSELLAEDGVLEATDTVELSALERLGRHEREELLRRASLVALDQNEQEAVYLRYCEGMPQERITELLGIQEKSGARGVLQRCRRKLQRELRKQLADMGHGSSFVRLSED